MAGTSLQTWRSPEPTAGALGPKVRACAHDTTGHCKHHELVLEAGRHSTSAPACARPIHPPTHDKQFETSHAAVPWVATDLARRCGCRRLCPRARSAFSHSRLRPERRRVGVEEGGGRARGRRRTARVVRVASAWSDVRAGQAVGHQARWLQDGGCGGGATWSDHVPSRRAACRRELDVSQASPQERRRLATSLRMSALAVVVWVVVARAHSTDVVGVTGGGSDASQGTVGFFVGPHKGGRRWWCCCRCRRCSLLSHDELGGAGTRRSTKHPQLRDGQSSTLGCVSSCVSREGVARRGGRDEAAARHAQCL